MRVFHVVVAMILFTSASVVAESAPVLVSPGSTDRTEQVAGTCPTFSWGGAAEATAYELAVYEVRDDGTLGEQVIRERLPKGAQGWTPAVRRCLTRARIYAWMVGAVTRDGITWSEPALFQVAPGTTEQEFREALLVVRSYLAAVEDAVADVEQEAPVAEASPGSPRTARKAAPAEPLGTSLFNVNGTMEATSFIGDGSGLTALDPASLSAGTAAIDISGNAANITGTLGSGQLSGTYSNALTFSNASNSFTGNGSGLTGVSSTDPTKVAKAGDTMTGTLILSPGAGNALEANADVDLDGDLYMSGELFLHVNGSSNTAVGESALLSGGGGSNTAVGSDAMRLRTSGDRNTAVGLNALENNTSGSDNTAVGDNANRSGNGSDNTAVGEEALRVAGGDGNTAVGEDALYSNSTGDDNTAVGRRALRLSTGGEDNTAVGWGALINSTGNSNIAVGKDAGSVITSGDGNIYLAHPGIAGDTTTLRVGFPLTHAYINGIRGVTTNNNNAIQVLIDSSGQLGTASSSRRFKTDIRDMGDVSSRLLGLRPVSFTYKQHADGEESAADPGSEQYGLIAEEVDAVFPELVVHDSEGHPETVRYHLLSSLLLNELQKQRRLIEELAAELGRLTGKPVAKTRIRR